MKGIEFHYFHEGLPAERSRLKFPPCQGSLTAEALETLLRYLRRHYDVLKAEDFLEGVLSGYTGENAVCLTFDDGLLSQWDIAWPVLESLDMTGFFFVCSAWLRRQPVALEVYHDFRFREYDDVEDYYEDFFAVMRRHAGMFDPSVFEAMARFRYGDYLPHCPWHSYEDKRFRYTRDRLLKEAEYHFLMETLMQAKGYDPRSHYENLWLGPAELRALRQKGNVIGLHSHTHPTVMDSLPYERQREEYAQNQACLTEVLGQRPDTVAYPCGVTGETVTQIMQSLGVRVGFTAREEERKDPLFLPRINHPRIVERMAEDL